MPLQAGRGLKFAIEGVPENRRLRASSAAPTRGFLCTGALASSPDRPRRANRVESDHRNGVACCSTYTSDRGDGDEKLNGVYSTEPRAVDATERAATQPAFRNHRGLERSHHSRRRYRPAAGPLEMSRLSRRCPAPALVFQASLRASVGLILSARLAGPMQASRHAASITAAVMPNDPA